MQATKPILSPQEVQRFNQEGYVVFDPNIPVEVIDGVIEDCGEKYDLEYTPEGNVIPTRLQDAWKFSRNVHKIAVWPSVLEALRELYGRKPLPFQTLNFPTGTQQAAHADTIHFNSLPHTFMCGVWVALEDMDMENGPLVYYPGSNMLPEFTMADAGVPAHSENYPAYEAFIRRVIEEFELKPEYGTIKKGEALIWSSNLIHGGTAQTDPKRSRHSQVTHFFFEGCRYYTPLDTHGTNVFWRNPEWMPDLPDLPA